MRNRPTRTERTGARPGRRLAAGAVAAAIVAARRHRAHRLGTTVDGERPGLVTDDGVVLHTEVVDRSDVSVTVVFAHGFAARMEEYDAQRGALGDRARLVLYDQRGHGRSGWRGGRAATIDRLGRDLGQVVDELTGSGPVVVVCHSMGGMALLSLAGQRPELIGTRIVGIALLSTLARPDPPGDGVPARVLSWLRRGLGSLLAWTLWVAAPAVEAVGPFRRSWGRRWLRGRLFGSGHAPEPVVSAMQDMWADMSQAMGAAFYPALAAYDRTDALGVLRAVPSVVLAGTADSTIPAHHSEHLAEELGASARLVLVPGAGHMVNMTHPGIVNAALRELLDRVAPRVPTAAGR